MAAQVELHKLLRPHWKRLSPPTTDTGELEGYGHAAREANSCHKPRRRCRQPTPSIDDYQKFTNIPDALLPSACRLAYSIK